MEDGPIVRARGVTRKNMSNHQQRCGKWSIFGTNRLVDPCICPIYLPSGKDVAVVHI